MKQPTHRATFALLLPLLLGSCGLSNSSLPDDQAYRTQRLNWTACDPTILGHDAAEMFQNLGARLVCADIQVPMNWKAPREGMASVALIRLKAASPAGRKGAIFFNPGGPGGDGLAFAPRFGLAWGQADPSTAVGANLKQLTEEYDLVGFSPRGVGASTRLYCGTNELVNPIRPPASDRSEANIASMTRLGRSLMGDAKLNYVGYSYGSWLGAWYAKLFPQHTGRMLLDANMPFHGTMQSAFENDALSFERDFREVAAPYLDRHDSVF